MFTLRILLTTMSQRLLPKCLPTKFCIPQKCQACQMDTRLFGQQLNGSFFSLLGQKKGRPWWLVNAFDHWNGMWFHQLLFTLRKYVGQEFSKKTKENYAQLTGRRKHDIWVEMFFVYLLPSAELIHRPTIGGRWPVIFWKVVLFGVTLLWNSMKLRCRHIFWMWL